MWPPPEDRQRHRWKWMSVNTGSLSRFMGVEDSNGQYTTGDIVVHVRIKIIVNLIGLAGVVQELVAGPVRIEEHDMHIRKVEGCVVVSPSQMIISASLCHLNLFYHSLYNFVYLAGCMGFSASGSDSAYGDDRFFGPQYRIGRTD